MWQGNQITHTLIHTNGNYSTTSIFYFHNFAWDSLGLENESRFLYSNHNNLILLPMIGQGVSMWPWSSQWDRRMYAGCLWERFPSQVRDTGLQIAFFCCFSVGLRIWHLELWQPFWIWVNKHKDEKPTCWIGPGGVGWGGGGMMKSTLLCQSTLQPTPGLLSKKQEMWYGWATQMAVLLFSVYPLAKQSLLHLTPYLHDWPSYVPVPSPS